MRDYNEETSFICAECDQVRALEDELGFWDDDEGVCTECADRLNAEGMEDAAELNSQYEGASCAPRTYRG